MNALLLCHANRFFRQSVKCLLVSWPYIRICSLTPVVWDRLSSTQQTAREPRRSQLLCVENKPTVWMVTLDFWGPVSQETDAPTPSVTIWGTWRRILVIFRRCTFIEVLREIRKSKKSGLKFGYWKNAHTGICNRPVLWSPSLQQPLSNPELATIKLSAEASILKRASSKPTKEERHWMWMECGKPSMTCRIHQTLRRAPFFTPSSHN